MMDEVDSGSLHNVKIILYAPSAVNSVEHVAKDQGQDCH